MMDNYLKLLKEAVGGERGDKDIHVEIAKFFVKNSSPSGEDIDKFTTELGISIEEFNKHLYMIMGELSQKGLLKVYLKEDALNELFINMAELSELEDEERDKKMLRLSIIAELDAANLYEQMADITDNPDIEKVMLDVAKEEKVHAGEFQSLLKNIDPEHEPALKDGEKEVDEMNDKED